MSVEKLELYITTADIDSLEALLKQDPELAKSRTSQHISPLLLSCYYKKSEITDIILKYLDQINLFEAAAAGKFVEVTHLVYTNPEAINFYGADGFTPLGLACCFGHYEIARYLVLKGADVNMPSRREDNGIVIVKISLHFEFIFL